MPRVTFSFKLPEELEEYDLARKAGDHSRALCKVLEYLRTQLKYKEMPEHDHALLSSVREDIIKIINEENYD